MVYWNMYTYIPSVIEWRTMPWPFLICSFILDSTSFLLVPSDAQENGKTESTPFIIICWPGLCSTQIFRADSTLTHVTILVIQQWLNSTVYFSWLTQLRLNSNPEFTNLTQLRLNLFESELSQIWLTTHHILPNLTNICWPGGGGRSNVAIGWFLPCNTTNKCKNLTFSLQRNKWLNFDSSSIHLTQLWLKWRSAWFDSDSTHAIDFHGRLNSDSTYLSRVKFDSRLMSRAQPWCWHATPLQLIRRDALDERHHAAIPRRPNMSQARDDLVLPSPWKQSWSRWLWPT